MPRLIVLGRNGTERTIEAEVGRSLMEVIRANGFDELLALCGGGCTCATCHVQIDPGMMKILPRMSEAENEMLEESTNRNETSRLACQIFLNESLDGLRVQIVVED